MQWEWSGVEWSGVTLLDGVDYKCVLTENSENPCSYHLFELRIASMKQHLIIRSPSIFTMTHTIPGHGRGLQTVSDNSLPVRNGHHPHGLLRDRP